MRKPTKKLRLQGPRRRQFKRVSFHDNFRDYQCAMLTLLGFSLRFVSQETGFTIPECSYRASLLGIRRAYYRDGLTDLAFTSIETMLERVETTLTKTYRINFKKQ